MRRNKVSCPMMLNLPSFKHKWNIGRQLLREVKVKLSDSDPQLEMKFDKYNVIYRLYYMCILCLYLCVCIFSHIDLLL